jgi:hypothetical protein
MSDQETPLREPTQLALKLHYLGVCSLLGRLSQRHNISGDDLDSIEHALADCAAFWPTRLEVVRTTNGGFSLEPKNG